MDQEAAVRTKFLALRPVLDERLSRLWAGAEAAALGDGGIAIVERGTGLSRTTIRAGRDELRAGVSAEDVVLVRRVGGGRPRIEETTPEIIAGWSRWSTRSRAVIRNPRCAGPRRARASSRPN